jgi:hypothetical protein
MRMVRRLLLPGLLILGVVAATAVPAEAQGIGVGIKAGPVFNKLILTGDDDDEEDLTSRTGWMAGLFIGGNRPGLVGVGVEINYIKRTSRDPDTEEDFGLQSIDIPVYLRINGGSRTLDGVSFYGIVGPAFDINLKADVDGFDIKDQVEDFDINLVIGGGVEITRFIIEGRYMRGLRNLQKDLGDSTSSAKSSSFAVLFGVRFN